VKGAPRRLGRLPAALGVVLATLAVLPARVLRARAEETLIGTGKLVLRSVRGPHGVNVDRLVVNGVPVRIASGSSPDAPSAVLDRLASGCASFEPAPDSSVRSALVQWLARAARFDGTLRAERGGVGAMACFERPRELGFVDALAAFLATGDLSAAGRFRLALVERGTESTTHVVVSLDGPAVVARAFPAAGDAPGDDVPGAPRPPSSRRVLSASTEGRGAVLAVYSTAVEGARACLDFEATSLARRGFRIERREGALVARRGDEGIVVHASPEGGSTSVVVMAL
jgi:hypothetical protein